MELKISDEVLEKLLREQVRVEINSGLGFRV